MHRGAKGTGFKMKGHTLKGINQRSEGNTDLADGRSGSAAFQHTEAEHAAEHAGETAADAATGVAVGGIMGKNVPKYKSAFKQTDDDLRDWLLDERGFSQVEADQMITEGAYTTEDEDFLTWYAGSGRGDVPAEPKTPIEYAGPRKKRKIKRY